MLSVKILQLAFDNDRASIQPKSKFCLEKVEALFILLNIDCDPTYQQALSHISVRASPRVSKPCPTHEQAFADTLSSL